MNTLHLSSDQLLARSVVFGKQVYCHLARASREAAQAAPTPAQHSARVTYRALQTLRQSKLSLCSGPWSWPQVLSLRKFPRTAAANGLRPAGVPRAGQRVTVGLSTRARGPGRDLRDQPGAPASSGDTLSEYGERDRSAHHPPPGPRHARSAYIPRAGSLSGHPVRQHADRQYVGRTDRYTGFVLHRRGERS